MTVPVQGYDAGVLRTVVAIAFELGSTGSGTHCDFGLEVPCCSAQVSLPYEARVNS